MRVTIERTVWAKIQTQLGKDRNKDLKDIMPTVPQISYSPTRDAILWDPPVAVLEGLKKLLINEQGFARKPDSAGYKLTDKVIERLGKNILQLNSPAAGE